MKKNGRRRETFVELGWSSVREPRKQREVLIVRTEAGSHVDTLDVFPSDVWHVLAGQRISPSILPLNSRPDESVRETTNVRGYRNNDVRHRRYTGRVWLLVEARSAETKNKDPPSGSERSSGRKLTNERTRELSANVNECNICVRKRKVTEIKAERKNKCKLVVNGRNDKTRDNKKTWQKDDVKVTFVAITERLNVIFKNSINNQVLKIRKMKSKLDEFCQKDIATGPKKWDFMQYPISQT